MAADGYDLIDELIDELNDGIDWIIFDRDLMDTNRPGDWGAAALSGEDDAEWADGRMIDQDLKILVWVCVSDRGSGIKREVQPILARFCEEKQMGWRFVSRQYAYDLDKFEWCWELIAGGPLAEAESEE